MSSSWNSTNIMDTATYASLAAIPWTKVPASVASSHRIQKTERPGVTRNCGANFGSGKSAFGDISETGKFQPIKDDFCDQHLPILCHPRRDTNELISHSELKNRNEKDTRKDDTVIGEAQYRDRPI